MNEKYIEELRKTFPNGLDKFEGQILWGLLINSDVYTPDGDEVGASFRGTGKVMAELVGEGDYLDYYMQNNLIKHLLKSIGFDADKLESDLKEKLDNDGWRIEEIILEEEQS